MLAPEAGRLLFGRYGRIPLAVHHDDARGTILRATAALRARFPVNPEIDHIIFFFLLLPFLRQAPEEFDPSFKNDNNRSFVKTIFFLP
jgi:hypothetical protein